MAKRFTETDKWFKNIWFRKLPLPYKLTWLYILDVCDSVGVWEVDFQMLFLVCGIEVNEEEVLKHFGSRIHVFKEKRKWWIKDFCHYQYGNLADNSRTYSTKSHITLLKKHDLWHLYQRGSGWGCTPPQVQEKETEQDKEQDTEKEKDKYLADSGHLPREKTVELEGENKNREAAPEKTSTQSSSPANPEWQNSKTEAKTKILGHDGANSNSGHIGHLLNAWRKKSKRESFARVKEILRDWIERDNLDPYDIAARIAKAKTNGFIYDLYPSSSPPKNNSKSPEDALWKEVIREESKK